MNKHKSLISIAIIVLLVAGAVFYYFNSSLSNECSENDNACYEEAVRICEKGVRYRSFTRYSPSMVLVWNHEILGKEDGLCKVLRVANNKIRTSDGEIEEILKIHLYYEFGNPKNIVKTERISSEQKDKRN